MCLALGLALSIVQPSHQVVLHSTSRAMLSAFSEQAHAFLEAQSWRRCAICRHRAGGPILARPLPLQFERSGRNAPPVPLLQILSLGRAMAILLACSCTVCSCWVPLSIRRCAQLHLIASMPAWRPLNASSQQRGPGLSLPAVAPVCDEHASLGVHEWTSAWAQLPVSPI
jgi:hypothetical protein